MQAPTIVPQTRPIRIAVIGCGALAQSQHLPNIVAAPQLSLQACCDVSDETLTACQARFSPAYTSTDFAPVVRDPDVELIVLAATERLRLPVIRAAAEAGKPIYVEKPMARSLEESYQIQQIVRDAGIPFCIGHNRRSAPAMIEAHQIFRQHMENPTAVPWRWERESPRMGLAEEGVPGMSVRVNDDWHSWKNWVFDKEQAPHGPMLFEMTHFTDMCNWFMDDEPEVVTALDSGMLNSGVVIRYRNGAIATIGMFANGTFGYPKELYEVFGQGAAVAVDHMLEVRTVGIDDAPPHKTYAMLNDRHSSVGTEGGLSGWLAKKRTACEEAAAAGDPLQQFTAEPDKGHAHHLHRFVAEVTGQGPMVCGVDEAVRATQVAIAAIQSARQGKPVLVETLGPPTA
ncbi:Gfo/Idh/MocA family protein [Phycisphaerales bacterium AB-hyl4]|uniref:Gfo/Idh/MocA family protein n=1 Tax=Natronomicrosphaera hydrolytica TaxID=3242702 RepID=A0ABV4U8I9_9BACT